MLSAFIYGTLAGFILALPPGPVGVTAIKYSLFADLKAGNKFALANFLMDFFYCFIAIFATSTIANEIIALTNEHPFVVIGTQFIIVAALILYGFLNLKNSRTHQFSEKVRTKKFNFISKFENKGPFLIGIAIALTNIANPSFFGTLTYLTVNIFALNLVENVFSQKSLFAFGFGLGNFLWLSLLMRVVFKFKHRISEQMMTRIQQFAGISFIGFGTILGARLILITKWGEILKFVFVF